MFNLFKLFKNNAETSLQVYTECTQRYQDDADLFAAQQLVLHTIAMRKRDIVENAHRLEKKINANVNVRSADDNYAKMFSLSDVDGLTRVSDHTPTVTE